VRHVARRLIEGVVPWLRLQPSLRKERSIMLTVEEMRFREFLSGEIRRLQKTEKMLQDTRESLKEEKPPTESYATAQACVEAALIDVSHAIGFLQVEITPLIQHSRTNLTPTP
jgi:hypothetical protein